MADIRNEKLRAERAPAAALPSVSVSALVGILGAFFLARLALAATFPLANDEAYYWDWARAPALSYLDHPPGVACIAWLGGKVVAAIGAAVGADWTTSPLGPRLIPLCLHLAATAFVFGTARLLKDGALGRAEVAFILVATQLAPGLSLGGAVLLPDSGLVVAMTAALFFATWRLRKPQALGLADGLIFGALCGLAGLFKYHAAPMALGLGGGLLALRKGDGRSKLILFSVGAAASALTLTAPVWVWNWQHGLASFRFQSEHGFGGFSWHLVPLARALSGQILLVSPGVMWMVLLAASPRRGKGVLGRPGGMSGETLGAWSFWPLFLLILIASLGKQTLPHWVLPAFWMMLPTAALYAATAGAPTRRLLRWNARVFGTLAWLAPWCLAVPAARAELLTRLGGAPGPLAELTLWPELSTSLVTDARAVAARVEVERERAGNSNCAGRPEVVSLRWFWVAQLAFHLPGQPSVGSLEVDKLSYYRFRDAALATAVAPCAMLLVGDARHFDAAALAPFVGLSNQFDLHVNGHDDVPVMVAVAHLRGWPGALEKPGLPGLKALDVATRTP